MNYELTPREQSVLEFIRGCQEGEGFTPTMAEIADEFDWKSPNAAQEVVVKLINLGFMYRPRRNRLIITEYGLRYLND